MKVSFVKHAERPSLLTILCEEEPWREVHTSIFGRRPTLPKGCQTLDELHREFAVLEYQCAKNYAMRRLSIQSMLAAALARSLKERLVSAPTIQKVLEELASLGFLNDEEWAASFVRTQNARKVGPRAIAQKLATKGVRGECLEQALQNSWNTSDQESSILQLLKSRYAKRNLLDFKERQKVIASLVRRGFDLPVILNCLRQFE